MAIGRPRKPASLKVVAGTRRKADRDRDALAMTLDLSPFTEVPPPPDWLPNAHAVKEWNRLAPVLVANKLLTVASVAAFGQLCAMHGKLVQLWSAGETPVASAIAQYRNLINDFGMTPAAQGKIKPAGDHAPTNAFTGNGVRPRQA